MPQHGNARDVTVAASALERYPWTIDPHQLERAAAQPLSRFELGHFYCTIPDTRELARPDRMEQVWPLTPYDNPAIDWRGDAQRELCTTVFAGQERLDFPRQPVPGTVEYFTANDQYPVLDAWILEGMLRHVRPRRVVECGSGFSTLVTARVNRDLLGGAAHVTCIEPYPRPFLQHGIEGIAEVRVEELQQTPLSLFGELEAGDVLFVDTTHTVKTGGDVPWIFSRVLPQLPPGVYVHVHDIYLPGDYPKRWVLEGWGWNENYLVEAFLSYNSAFEVVFSNQWMVQNALPELVEAFPGLGSGEHDGRTGSSLWLRRTDA